jgi:hypothetical protein
MTIIGKSVRVAGAMECRLCGKDLSAAAVVGYKNMRPKDGDLSICIYCGTLAFYANNVTALRVPTDSEMQEIKRTHRWKELEAARLEAARRMQAKKP